jgi:hypothetical protein
MAYLYPVASDADYGVVEVGDFIDVFDGVISIPQDVSTTSTVTFANVEATNTLTLDGNSVITAVTPIAGPGISISGLDIIGPEVEFAVNNTGVISLVAGTGISLTGSTGNITVSATGADFLNTTTVTSNYTATATDEYIGANSATLVTITLPLGIPGRVYTIKDQYGTGTGRVNVQGTGTEKIDGSPFKQLSAWASITVVFNDGQWRII